MGFVIFLALLVIAGMCCIVLSLYRMYRYRRPDKKLSHFLNVVFLIYIVVIIKLMDFEHMDAADDFILLAIVTGYIFLLLDLWRHR